MDTLWTNSVVDLMYPPGITYTNLSGMVVVSNQFDAALLNALGSAPQDGIPLYPVVIRDSLGSRTWKNSHGTVVTNTPIPAAYDADQWVLDHYSLPANLGGPALEDWMADRRLDRKSLRLELIRSVDVPAWLAAWSNRLAATQSMLDSNDLGSVKAILMPDIPAMDLWVQVPQGIDYVGIYKTPNLENPFPWAVVGTVDAPQSPLWVRVPLADVDVTAGSGGGAGFPGLPSGGSTNAPSAILTVMEHILLANHSLDSDGDGLLDAIEQLLTGTNSQLVDSDGDGVDDGDEVNLYGSNPLVADSDADGLSDGDEIALGTLVLNPDTDGDGLRDGWEVMYALDPLDDGSVNHDNGADGDPDLDGMRNLAEQALATLSPRAEDSDADGTKDAQDDANGDQISDVWEPINRPEIHWALRCVETWPMPAEYVLFDVNLAWAFHDVFDPTLAPPMRLTIRDAEPGALHRKIHDQGSGEHGPKHAILEKGRAYEITLSGYTDPNEVRGSGSITWSEDPHPHRQFENDPGNPVAYYFARGEEVFAVYDEHRWRGKELLSDISTLTCASVQSQGDSPIEPYLPNPDPTGDKTILYLPKVDLDVHAWKKCGFTEEDLEKDPGLFIRMNINDSNTNGIPDDLDTEPMVIPDPELVQLGLSLAPIAMPIGFARLESLTNGVVIQVWSNAYKEGQIILPAQWAPGDVPESVFVEGAWVDGEDPTTILRFSYQIQEQGCDDPIHLVVSNDLKITVLPPLLVPDYNRDRIIDEEDVFSIQQPFRFWVNSDNDESATKGNDIPQGDHGNFDFYSPGIDGERDLIDWMPVHVNIASILPHFPESEYIYRIGVDSYNPNLVNLMHSLLDSANAGSYLTQIGMFDILSTRTIRSMAISHPLQSSEIQAMIGFNQTVFLFEFFDTSVKCMWLEVRKRISNQIFYRDELPLSISEVEEMFRHRNLRFDVGRTDGALNRMQDPPNWPDAERASTHFLFVHGYNVNGEEARGWQSEMFKRLYWTGNNSKFHGITWWGNESDVGAATISYHLNVENAFIAGAALENYISEFIPVDERVVVAGHSLGNMVLSSALEDHALSADTYFMLNPAVALECYDGSLINSQTHGWEKMMHCDWRINDDPSNPPEFERRLWASDWHRLFPLTDERSRLTWSNRFESVETHTFHFYSSGEEILENFDNNGAVCFWGTSDGVSRGAWVKQEKLKGRTTFNAGGTPFGGWGFNFAHYTCISAECIPPFGAQVNGQSNSVFIAEPLFSPHFGITANGLAGSQNSAIYHSKILGEMIPSLTYSAGANPISKWNSPTVTRNFNMQDLRNGWPAERLNDELGNLKNRWWHNDITDVAFTYVYKVFDQLSETGGLK